MNLFKGRTVLNVLLGVMFLGGVSSGVTQTGDPNAEIRKIGDPNKTLRELEKVKKINNDLAIKHFTERVQKNDKDALSYARRGKAYSGNKDYAKAMEDYNEAVKIDPSLAEAYVGRAVVFYIQKNFDASWDDVHKAESLGGKFWPTFMDALKQSSGREK